MCPFTKLLVLEIISPIELRFNFQNIWNTALCSAYLLEIWKFETNKFKISIYSSLCMAEAIV